MKFKGDVIITDPCYIDTKDNKLWDDTTGKFDLHTGSGLEYFGFTSYIYRDTIYGDWSCTTYNKDTKEEIGSFCADAGLVGVFLLDEILKFNPKYNVKEEVERGSATLIKDFDGDIWDEVVQLALLEDQNEEDYYEDEEVRIIGKGNINFYTSQTGA